MANRKPAIVPDGAARADGAGGSVLRAFLRLAGGYWRSEARWVATGLLLAIVALTIAQVAIAVWLNRWNADFFDALEQRDGGRIAAQLVVFAAILLSTILVNTLHIDAKRRLEFGWRQWLTVRMLHAWMVDGREYQIGRLPDAQTNVDGRIAEDIRISTELAIELGHSSLYCAVLLASFVGILWGLSGTIVLPLGENGLSLDGHMVWLAAIYAVIGSTFAFVLGRPLVRATDWRQTLEADFRFGLVRARENAEAIALIAGEASERRALAALFIRVGKAWRAQSSGLSRLMLFTSGYSTLAALFPILVSSPRYIVGAITLGGLMQIAQAFQQVTAALSWLVDNFPRIAEWRASVERVVVLHRALELLRTDAEADAGERIVVRRIAGQSLQLHDVAIATPTGVHIVDGLNAELMPGQRVLISGDSRVASILFKAIAGIWPWGRGRIDLPENGQLFFLPQRPYLPNGRLIDALAFPGVAASHDQAAIEKAMRLAGLADLIPRLQEIDTWDRQLTVSEQQRLGFARLFLHRPDWIFIEEATDALEPETERSLMETVARLFASAGIVTVSHHAALEPLHQRILTLARDGAGEMMLRETAGGPRQPDLAPARRQRGLFDFLREGFGIGRVDE